MKKLIFLFLCLLSMSCEFDNINYLVPIMEANEPNNIFANSATLGGRVISEGGKDIVEYGIVYSTNFPPTINDIKIKIGGRLGSFSDVYDVFEPSTTYYYTVYGVNEIGAGYGIVYEFTTGVEAPCSPVKEDFIDLGYNEYSLDQINISSIELTRASNFNEGNMEFVTSSSSSVVRIFLNFNETDQFLPQTGEYTVLRSFNSNDQKSNGEAILSVQNYDIWGPGGDRAESGVKFYVEKENNNVTFIFCDTPIGDTYVLNGKFTYSE